MDNLDMKILSKLVNNCRKSDRQIGKELKISGGAVNTRIRKMGKKEIIEEFTIKVEPTILGFDILYIVVSGEDIKEILEQIKLVGEPFIAVPCIGGITVCGIVIKENMELKIKLARKLMTDVKVLSIFESKNQGINSNLTKTDLQILDELIKNPRQKIETISKNTNLSAKTVTRCIEKLHKNEEIQFTVLYNPQKIEGFIPHVLLTGIKKDLKKTLKKLNRIFSESYLQIPIISKNQIALIMYSKNIFQMDELAQKVRKIENVNSVDLFIPKKISLYLEWLKKAIIHSKKSSTLHLVYQTN